LSSVLLGSLRVDPWVVLKANYVINSESIKLLYDDLMLLIMIYELYEDLMLLFMIYELYEHYVEYI